MKFYNLKQSDKIVKILYKHPSLRAELEDKLKVDLKGYELGEKINLLNEIYKINE